MRRPGLDLLPKALEPAKVAGVERGFETAAIEYATRYARVSGSAVAMTKRLLYDIDADDLSAAIAKGVETNARARMTDDCKKGIAKFLEK